ncbi:phage terminase large subunit family protein [Luteimonas sp. J29]|uniref:phage terminase large subunit family protein n=1 Tax=Luteimonas sp. J29 TaxID=935863 RepID=UPI0004BBC0CF|nr:phage terminase large subunit family protein [Luteimonas sp. J29]
MTYLAAQPIIFQTVARAIAPRKPMRVSEWAARYRVLSSKGSQEPGPWRNERNPLLVEIMDCFSARSPVRDVVARLPIQFGKSELEANVLGYTMCENPMPIIVALPAEVSMNKWIDQKLNPLIEETPAVQAVMTSLSSREASNRRSFKDFQGGQLYIEHAGNPVRLKQTSAGLVLADEFSSFATALKTGDDPGELLDGRTTAFQSKYKRLKVGTPEIVGQCRISELYEKSDQRRYYVPCPDCGHEQPLDWSGVQWTPDGSHAWYACRECGAVIEEHQKTALIAAGRWVPENPGAAIRGYHANALYYPIGLGPRWVELVRMWRDAQGDPARLKTFINDRLAEPWEDPAMRAVKFNIIAERTEPLPLRPVPNWVLAVTAGVDTQDNRLPVQIVGWGRGMTCWPIDYIELPGDPADDEVWTALTALLNAPIERQDGALLRLDASAQDMGGHRTEAVKAFVRSKRVRRHIAVFGATANNAPPLGKPRLHDINWRGQVDKRGVHAYQVGTVAIKHHLFSLLSTDADKPAEERKIRFSDELSPDYFGGLVSETYNPRKNRFEKIRGTPRNEPLDTWVYAYAAALHPELRMNRWTRANWDAREAQVLATIRRPAANDSRETPPTQAVAARPANDSRGTRPRRRGAVVDPD